jgi:hypothetical protein
VLRTASCPASMAGPIAVRSTQFGGGICRRLIPWVDGVPSQDRSLRGNSLGLRKNRHDLCGEAANVPQRHLLRHAAEIEGPRDDGEPQRDAPASDNVDAALRISCNHIAPRDLLRGLEPSRRGAPRVLGIRNRLVVV